MGIKKKLQLLLAFTTLLTIALAAGCKGFFVNQPTAMTVTPASPTLSQGGTQQFSAVATLSDNTTSDVTKSALWTSSPSCTVTIGSSNLKNSGSPGFATAIGTGTSVTITAIFNGVQATANPVPPAGLAITPCGLNSNGHFKVGSAAVSFTASLAGSPAQGVTWTSNNSSVVSITSAGTATFPTVGSTFITARDSSANQGQLSITVNTDGQ